MARLVPRPCDWTPQIPPPDLPGKLTPEAYDVHFICPAAGHPGRNPRSRVIRADQMSCGTAWVSKFLPGGSGSAEAAAAMSALSASASSEARPVGHETRNAVEHMGQALLELLFPLILGKAGRQAVQCRETPGVDLVRGVDELTRAAGVRDRRPLLRRTGGTQPAGHPIGRRHPAR